MCLSLSEQIESGSVWKQVYQDLGIPVLNSAAGYNVKCAYRKYVQTLPPQLLKTFEHQDWHLYDNFILSQAYTLTTLAISSVICAGQQS